MKAKIAKKWAKALKSGEYQQGRDQLRYENKFCCLGVLCDLYAKEHDEKWDDGVFYGDAYGVPLPVREWSGLKTKTGYYTKKKFKGSDLVCLNDTERKSFKEIADTVLKYVKNL